MKVPKYIKQSIIKCANYNEKSNIEERKIYKWLTKNKLTEDTCGDNLLHSMDDPFIDWCQLSNFPERFIEKLENLEKEENK